MSKNKIDTGRKLEIEPDGKHKKCLKCGRVKHHTSFNKDRRNKDGLDNWCRVCRLRNKKKERKKYNKKVDALKKGLVCAKCGESRTYVLDFHHNNPKKKIASISDMRDNQVSIEVIKKEIEKTTPLCANCHRELHYKKISIEEYLKETK